MRAGSGVDLPSREEGREPASKGGAPRSGYLPAMHTILVVDDDPNLREVVRYALARQGYTVREAGNGAEALRALGQGPADLVVLDVVMPELDGIDTCREIRKTSRVPIVFLSSRDEELDRVLGLELGADDYLTKPFSTRELVARVKAVLRRATPEPTTEKSRSVQVGTLRLDLDEHRAWAGELEIVLTVTEFSLLRVLMGRPGKVYTRDELVEHAYGEHHHVSERTLDSHVRRIRQKFREVGLEPVETVHGLGYRCGVSLGSTKR
jgi:two-component system OmpR family response regulator